MKKEYLKQIKNTIRDLKDNREYADIQAKQIENRYNEQIEELNLDLNSYHDKRLYETLQQRMNHDIYNCYETYGNDASIYIIYEDGSYCSTTGTEIVTGECTPKMQHIVYMHYMDGYVEMDTESGEMDYDISEDDQQEAHEQYMTDIEIKYQTVWGTKNSMKQ